MVSIASLAYLIMALGNSHISVANGRGFLWVRYADWAATTPLLLADLGLLVGASYADIAWIILAECVQPRPRSHPPPQKSPPRRPHPPRPRFNAPSASS